MIRSGRSLDNNRGFTLVEILMVIFIMGIVMGAVYSIYITHLRTSYTTDEVSDVQMNLKIAMDAVVKDLRMAGMLVDYQPCQAANPVLPIQVNPAVDNGPATPDPFTGVANPASDRLTINMASATGAYARINDDYPANTTATFAISPKQQDTQKGDVEEFHNGDVVRIIRPRDNSQPAGAATTFTVNAVSTTNGTITLNAAPAVNINRSDVIAKANAYSNTVAPSPNTIQYAVITYGASPSTNNTHPNCPQNQFCLARLLNSETDPNAGNGPRWEIVAQNIRNFQLGYVTSDAPTVVSATPPADYTTLIALRVTIRGQTVTTVGLSDHVIKVRQLETFVRLINKRN